MSKFLEVLFTDPAPVRRILQALLRRLRIGTYRFRYHIGAVDRPHYAYIVYQAAQLAAQLGQGRISVLEFGVAGGNGLLWMERHARKVEGIFPVKIDVYGFDTGHGLPSPKDYRDLPYHWQSGFFAMDHDALRSRLTRAKLVLGDIADTAGDFFQRYQPAPIAAVAHDMDFYSSTRDGLRLFNASSEHLMPRIFCYFDDTLGTDISLYSQFSGQRLAIDDFNRENPMRKIGILHYLRIRQALGAWVNQIWVCHNFDHPRYNDFISENNQELPIEGDS